MALNNTVKQMRELLSQITEDLEKAVNGNKAASQRVRTSSIRFEKTAKQYRKESITSEKKSGSKKTSSRKTTTKRTSAKSSKTTSRTASKTKKTAKRSTAKLPTKRRSARAR